MGQTPKPMRLYVTEKEMLEWGVFRELNAKGNLVKVIQLKSNTLLMGPRCHRLLPGMEKYVDVAIKSARQQYIPKVLPAKVKRPKKEKVKCTKVDTAGGAGSNPNPPTSTR